MANTPHRRELEWKVGLIANSLKKYTRKVLAPVVCEANKLIGKELYGTKTVPLQATIAKGLKENQITEAQASSALDDTRWLANLDGIGEIMIYDAGDVLPQYHFFCKTEDITDFNNRIIDMENGADLSVDPTHTKLSEIVKPDETTVIFNFACDDIQYTGTTKMSATTARFIGRRGGTKKKRKSKKRNKRSKKRKTRKNRRNNIKI